MLACWNVLSCPAASRRIESTPFAKPLERLLMLLMIISCILTARLWTKSERAAGLFSRASSCVRFRNYDRKTCWLLRLAMSLWHLERRYLFVSAPDELSFSPGLSNFAAIRG
jgi:hypothetical protein